MSYITEWQKKLRKARELELKEARKKRGVKIIVIRGK
jgi:hypothetical protein